MTVVPPDPYPVDTVTTYPLAPSLVGDGTLTRAAGPRTLAQQELFDYYAGRRELAWRRFVEAMHAAELAAASMTPREQAEAAYHPGGPSVDELEDRIRARRGLPPLDRSGAGDMVAEPVRPTSLPEGDGAPSPRQRPTRRSAPSQQPPAQLLSVAQAAEWLDCSRGHVYRLIAARQLRAVEIKTAGSKRPKTRVRTEDMQAFIEKNTRG